MNITEKAAYIKGLMDGMKLDADSNETKLFKAVADMLEDIALTVADLDDEVANLNEYVEELDECLGYVEDDLYDDECDGDCDCCDDDCDYCDDEDCDCCDDCLELECPECGESIYIDHEDLDEIIEDDTHTVVCPSCNKQFELSIDYEDDDECDCGCHDGE